jgi:deoxyribonuclease-4
MFIGAHMSVAGGVHTAFARAEAVGCTALQIFVKNASQWTAKPLEDEHVRLFGEERKRTGIDRVIAHDSYLINLGSPDGELWEKSVAALVDELERCEALTLDGLVAHPGSHVGTGGDAGLARIAEGLDEVFRRTRGGRCPVLLETTAGQGTNLGHRFEHLARIRGLVAEPERVGWCLDTCHVFAAGYDLRSAAAVAETLDRFDETCGIGRLGAIHLNDSLKPFASRRDRHAHIGEGEIGRDGFAALLRDPRLADVPMVLETPKGEGLEEDARNLEILRALAEGKTPDRRPDLRTLEWRKATLPGAAELAREKAERRAKEKTAPKARTRAGSSAKGSPAPSKRKTSR